jgi:hypothetical protein
MFIFFKRNKEQGARNKEQGTKSKEQRGKIDNPHIG